MSTPQQQPWPGQQQDQRYQGGPRQPGYQQRGFQQPGQPEVPDYLALAGGQLYKIARGIDQMSADKTAAGANGEQDPEIRELRFRLAEALTALADIQYGALDDGDDEDPEDDYQR